MKLIFRHRVIKIYAEANSIMIALKKTACNAVPNCLMNTFSEESFSYTMRGERTVIAPIHISGTVETQGGFCIMQYHMRPSITFIIFQVLFTVLGVYDFIRKFPRAILWWFFAFIMIIWFIPFLQFYWCETSCEKQILQKLNEIDKYHDVFVSWGDAGMSGNI